MTGDAFVQIVIGFLMICSAIISSYVVPYVKAKTDSVELEKLLTYAKQCVEWANQTIPADKWMQKKRSVEDKVAEFMRNNLKISLSEDQIDTIIEAFVIECKGSK